MNEETKARQALHMIERSVGEHGWFGCEEVETLEIAINELEDLRHNYKAVEEMLNNSAAYGAKIQAELNELKKDVARYFELLLGTAYNQDTEKEYRNLRDKLSKVEKKGRKKMNKVILIPIQPKWLVKILNGEKTIEIRKMMPKCDLPIDVYLYCTKGDVRLGDIWDEAYIEQFPPRYVLENGETPFPEWFDILNGRVVAKFTLKRVSTCLNTDYGNEEILKDARLTKQELDDRVGKRKFFAWHIDNLVIFDKPKELSEFSILKRETFYCGVDCPPYPGWVEYRVHEAPQSWQYAYIKGE